MTRREATSIVAPGRRRFLSALLGAVGALTARAGFAIGERGKIRLAQPTFPGAELTLRPGALERLAWELNLRTSVQASYEVARPSLDGRELFETPFLFLGGSRGFPPWDDAMIHNLRRHLEFGGLLLIDDSSGLSSSEFDRSARREAERLFPEAPLARLNDEHSMFRSYYLLRRLGGRVSVSPFLEGCTLAGRTPLVYCRNDLAGAWARDSYGHWSFDCTPGGEAQRQQAFALGVNAVLYALTVDYKQDQIHLPFIRQRMQR